MSWSLDLNTANRSFVENVAVERLPVRQPGPQAVFTCMDPRINLAAVGVPAHGPHGEFDSTVRVVRTLGARIDERSLAALIYLAGTKDVLVLTHTDCGATLAHDSIALINQRMTDRLDPARVASFRSSVGADIDGLRQWLRTFTDPEEAALAEINAARRLDFVPGDVLLSGAVYDVNTGRTTLVGTA